MLRSSASKSRSGRASKPSLAQKRVNSRSVSGAEKKSRSKNITLDRHRLVQEEAKIKDLEEKLRQKEEQARRRLEELPKKIAARRRRQEELMRLQLVATPTRPDGLSRLRDKRHPTHSPKQTRRKAAGARLAERRAARVQFLLLCFVLLTILFLIWHSLPS